MSLAYPLALLLLLLPPMLYMTLPPRRSADGALRLPSGIVQGVRAQPGFAHRVRHGWILPAASWTLVVLAVAGPRQVETLDILPASGRDIILAMDLSGSMEREDFVLDGERISRLGAVQRVASQFVAGRAGDRVGLVVFGARAYVAAPLTHDVASVARAIDNTTIGVSGDSTAIGDGLGLSLKRLSASEARSRVVILLSDGVDTAGSAAPAEVAEMAERRGIRVYTIALGLKDLETEPSASDAVDVATLRAIAEQSDGEMFRVRDMDALQAVAEAIDTLEPSPSSTSAPTVWREYWMWPAGAALVLMVLSLIFTRLRRR